MGPGWVFARGTISPDLKLDLTAYSTGLRAASFVALTGLKDTLDFRLDLHMAVKGPVRSPALAGWAKVYDTRLKGQSMPDSFVSAKATTEDFHVKGRFLGELANLEGRAQLKSGLPFLAELEFETEQLGKYIALLTDALKPKAAISGTVKASGHLLNPRSITARLRVEGFSIETTGFKLKKRQPLLVILDAGTFKLKQFEIAGTDTVLTISGSGTLKGGPRLKAEGRVGLGLLSLMVDFIPKAAGSANLRLFLRGPWDAPAVSGSAAFNAGLLRFSFLSQDIRSVTGTVQFTPQMIQISKLQGEIGGGSFTGQGWVEMKDFAPQRYSLNLEPERVRYNVTKNLWGIGSGTLSLQGSRGGRLLLSGEIRVSQGSFSERIALASLSDGVFRHRIKKTRTYAVEREVADFDINLRIPERFKVRYNLDLVNFQAEMKGNIRVSGTNERLGLQGDLEALEGKVTYLSKDFALQSTSVQFVDEFSIHPRVEVLATRTEQVDRGEEGKTDYHISLRMTADGNATPEIALTSDPPLEPHDIATLLHLGVTSQEVESLKSEDLVGLGGEILLRSFKLDERLSRMFPFPPEVIQPKYLRVRSRFAPGAGDQGGAVSPRVEVGAKLRLISDDLDVDYSRSLYDDTSQSLDLTYNLSEGVSTRLRWETDRETAPGDIGDLGLDLKLHWEW
jgi:autotransporter translocation and assembly factor TamB